uniref:Uncharacterized protein n=1 Tax=Ditylenchus dipsaci TaxID=166011 RepID=A0A915D3A6_9BILA
MPHLSWKQLVKNFYGAARISPVRSQVSPALCFSSAASSFQQNSGVPVRTPESPKPESNARVRSSLPVQLQASNVSLSPKVPDQLPAPSFSLHASAPIPDFPVIKRASYSSR